MSKSKAKGTLAETAVARFLLEHGWPFCERRALRGTYDMGDITGTPGICWEVKYAGGAIKMSAWMAETEQETINSGADVGVLVIKPPGIGMTRVGKWLACFGTKHYDELALASPLDLKFGVPQTYNSTRVMEDLVRLGEESIGLVVARAWAPGMKDFPMTWYHVMYLEDAVTLLRSAGYGNPPEQERVHNGEEAQDL